MISVCILYIPEYFKENLDLLNMYDIEFVLGATVYYWNRQPSIHFMWVSAPFLNFFLLYSKGCNYTIFF